MKAILNKDELDEGLQVLKFWATWCGPCKAYEPIIDKLVKEFDSVKFYSIDIDEAPELAEEFKIKSLPTVIFLKDQEEIDRVLGLSKIKPLRSKLKELSSSV